MSRKLSEVLAGLSHGLPGAALAAQVSGVTSDSREVRPGFVFVAVKGGTQDGHRFIPQAARDGAVAVVGQEPAPTGLAIPYVQVSDSRDALARLAASFHGNPSHSMLMLGVTGTSGKTTTTYLLESILEAAGHAVGVLGTVNFRFKGKVLPSTHTTPGAAELQALLAEMRAHGCTAVVMEVSSHALKQRRAAHLAFDGMVFTNLTPEHLDFHPDMEDYYRSKAILFTELAAYARAHGKSPVASVNAEDEYGRKLLQELRASAGGARAFSFGLAGGADFDGSGLQVDLSGVHGAIRCTVACAGGEARVDSGLTGRFNAQNILGAAALAAGMGVASEAIERGIAALATVPGRLERVANPRGIHVLVDYAHKPDALEKVLRTLKDVKGGHRLITVFGCGGDRDRKKRPVMGRCAVELSDHVFVTSDNPRTEDPQAILREILEGTKGHSNLTVEPDRRKAIHGAIAMARAGDLVVIAGKGHEDYQILADPSKPGGTYKIHFDDREVAAEALSAVTH